MTSEEEEAELNKCVGCGKEWPEPGWSNLDVCHECFDQPRVHLPIPPMCLDLDTEDHPSIVTLSHPYEHNPRIHSTHALNQSIQQTIQQTVKEAGKMFDKTFITGNGEQR